MVKSGPDDAQGENERDPAASGTSAPSDLAKTVTGDGSSSVQSAAVTRPSDAATMATQGPDPLQPQVLLPPGTRLGDVEIGELLGRGGMGAVYRGRQVSLDRAVAVKILPAHLGSNPDFRRRFELEAKAVARISSPHVVQVYGAGCERGLHFFVMEYVEGADLAARLKRGERLNHLEALDRVLQAAEGLTAAGEQDIVHRDIKPSNMMVTDDGRLKLMDFGLVKLTKAVSSVTMTGTVMGTVSYFSPEQGRGEECDQRTDIYALGVVFYELATGVLPFVGNDPTSVIYQHIHNQPRPPCEIDPTIPASFQAVILKCLQKRPEHRYQSAAELTADLRRLTTGQAPAIALDDPELLQSGATMRTQTDFRQAAAPRHRSTWRRPLLLVVLLAGVAAGWWWWPQLQEFYRRQLSAPGQPSAQRPATPTPVASDPSTDDTPPPVDPAVAWHASQRAAIQAGDWQQVAAALGGERPEMIAAEDWQRLRQDWRTAQLVAVRTLYNAGDLSAADQLLQPLQQAFGQQQEVDALASRIATLQAVAAAQEEARATAREADAGVALAALQAVAMPESAPTGLRKERDSLVQALTAAAQLSTTAEEALARGDLATARQSFLASFQSLENGAARRGLEVVAICEQFNSALTAGSLQEAAERLQELQAAGASEAVLAERRQRLSLAEGRRDIEAALAADDWPAAKAALAAWRQAGAEAEAVQPLQQRLRVGEQAAAVDRALALEDLEAAQAALTGLRELGAPAASITAAEQAIAASQLAERRRTEQLIAAVDELRGRLRADAPDYAALRQSHDGLVEEFGESAALTELAAAIDLAEQQAAAVALVAAVDQAVLAGDRAALERLVAATAHREALAALIGRPELAIAHRPGSLQPSEAGPVLPVTVVTSMQAVPELRIAYRYTLATTETGWQITRVVKRAAPDEE